MTDEFGSDVRAGQFIRIGIVHDDVAITRKRACAVGVAEGARQAHGAVLVRIFESCIDHDRRGAAVEPLFQIFLADAWDRHALYCERRARKLSNAADQCVIA